MSDRYVLLPRQGLFASSGQALDLLQDLPKARSTQRPREARLPVANVELRVIDTVSENGPKLVELEPEGAARINAAGSPLRAMRIVSYDLPDPHPRPLAAAAAPAVGILLVTCVDSVSGQPVPGVTVVGFTDFSRRLGDQGVTDASGEVRLRVSGPSFDRLYAYPEDGFWGAFRRAVSTRGPLKLALEPVDLAFADSVRHFYAGSQFDPTLGVCVGVIDTGVGPHRDLHLVDGFCTVTGEPASDYSDWNGHGTHVAGLVGSNATPPAGLRGVAPGVRLHAYRVFGRDQGATNYAVLKAVILAGRDRCDIVNLSLSGGPWDDVVREVVMDARNQGMLVIVAAGNGDRKSVSYPAAYPEATAVSALGIEGRFPVGSLGDSDVERPPMSKADPREFIAAFSNVGAQIATTAPGVAVLSTLPNDRHGALSGTAMAAPVVAGAAACLLSRNATIFGMPRDRARSDAMQRMLQLSCVQRGFGPDFEGWGLPDPSVV